MSAQDSGMDQVCVSTKCAECAQIVLAELRLQPHMHRKLSSDVVLYEKCMGDVLQVTN